MILITTTGKASMDTYAQQLANNVSVSKLYTNIYDQQDFGIPLLSWSAFRTAWLNVDFTLKLRHLRQPLHLPNQHFGRYGNFLSMPYIITVADMMRYFDINGVPSFLHHPNRLDRLYLKLDYSGIQRAKGIIAISNTTKRDIVRYLNIPEERVFVTYLGIDHTRFHKVKRRLIDGPYILFVGSEYPYKNLGMLLMAFKLLKQNSQFHNVKLVKIGSAGGLEGPFRQRTLELITKLNLEGDILIMDWVPSSDLPAYYSGAACFVFPSLYEGFGFPPLEAMACGCPVIVSNAGALPEITSNAALEISPHDPQGLAKAIEKVLTDMDLRQDLLSRGIRRAREFTWDRTVRETLKVYQMMESALKIE